MKNYKNPKNSDIYDFLLLKIKRTVLNLKMKFF